MIGIIVKVIPNSQNNFMKISLKTESPFDGKNITVFLLKKSKFSKFD